MHPSHETRGLRAAEEQPIEAARRVWLRAAGSGLLLVTLVGCASKPKVTSVSGNLVASADLNPSVSQRPSPLLLRVYELKSAAAFNQADFMALYQGDAAALGAEMVAREELTLQPGESRPMNKPLNAETRFVGVFAAYRNLEKARWRAVLPVQPGQAQKLTIRADALAVSIQAVP
jgi:type VI secretion system protein VasD